MTGSLEYLERMGGELAKGSLGVCSYSYTPYYPSITGYTYLFSKYEGIALRAKSSHGVIKFLTGGEGNAYERMRIDSAGNVRIGNRQPCSKLEVARVIFI